MSNIRSKDKCPCGSGRKYKKCCGISSRQFGLEESYNHYIKIRKAEGSLGFLVQRYLDQFGDRAVDDLFDSFYISHSESELEYPPEHDQCIGQMFISWVLFDVPYVLLKNKVKGPIESTFETLADKLLAGELNYSLRHDERMLLGCGIKSEFLIYQVEDFEEGLSITLREPESSRLIKVHEFAASKGVNKGDSIFARVISVSGINIFWGVFPLRISALHYHFLKKAIVASDKVQLPHDSFENFLPERFRNALKPRVMFFSLAEDLYDLQFRPPELRNTDNELMKMLRLTFKYSCCPEEIVSELKDFIEISGPNISELLSERSKKSIESKRKPIYEFPLGKKGNKLHRGWDNTVLAHAFIYHDKFVVEVNSEERAEFFKSTFMKRFGSKVSFEKQRKINLDKNKISSAEKNAMHSPKEMPEEIKQHIQKMAQAHWDSWYDIKVPALNNQTPRQAAKTKAGRDLLRVLLQHFENLTDFTNENYANPDINKIKATLGLMETN